jgi:hypothetical protein
MVLPEPFFLPYPMIWRNLPGGGAGRVLRGDEKDGKLLRFR